MSLLKSLWGGGAQDSEEKKSSEDVERGEPLESVEESVNPWVKGFGGRCEVSVLHGLCLICYCNRHGIECEWLCQQPQGNSLYNCAANCEYHCMSIA